MDMSWLHTFFEWVSSIITQIPYYYKHTIDVLGYGYSDKIGYPGDGVFVLIFAYVIFVFLNTYIPSVIVCPHLVLGNKFIHLLKGKPLGKESIAISDYSATVLYLFIPLIVSGISWSIHYLALKISCALIVFHTILFFTCVILENRRLKEQKQEESRSDVVLVSAQ